MSDKYYDIIKDAEAEYCTELDNDFDLTDVLCNGLGCRHSECDCWTSFDLAVRELLRKQLGIVVHERNTTLDPSKYHATSDSYDGAPDSIGKHSVVGYGDTEEEAVFDLLDIWEEIAEREAKDTRDEYEVEAADEREALA